MQRAWTRRDLLVSGAGAIATASAPSFASLPPGTAQTDVVGERLTPWRPGALDIHHIATGRGDAALVIGPTGSSLLIDAGASASPLTQSIAPQPGDARRPGEWIARYARRHLEPAGGAQIDVALLTHLHPDHVGDVDPSSPLSGDGTFRLTGISEVDAHLPIRKVIDRGFPAYDWPAPGKAPFASNYVAWARSRERQGRQMERVRVGASDQLSPVLPEMGFEIRALAGNGEVWNSAGDSVTSLVPALSALPAADWPDENVLSAALRIRFGDFSYFAAGDLTANTFDGALPWRDVATAAARSCGPVDVAVAPHHGMFDGLSGDMVRVLSPRAWIIQAWHASHPNLSALERMLSERLYPGPRDILATGLTAAGELVNKRLTDRFAARRGHVVVRVTDGGRTFRIVSTDKSDEHDRVAVVLGPFRSRGRPA